MEIVFALQHWQAKDALGPSDSFLLGQTAAVKNKAKVRLVTMMSLHRFKHNVGLYVENVEIML